MKTHCPRGRIYPDEIEAKIALAEGLLAGRRASGWYFHEDCGGYHVGSPERLTNRRERCWATAKMIFKTEDEADDELRKLKSRGREERGRYRCDHCGAYHLTSAPQEKERT